MAAEERDVPFVALVTGGARGIGFEVVKQLALQGNWAATIPDDGPSGGFFRDGESMPW